VEGRRGRGLKLRSTTGQLSTAAEAPAGPGRQEGGPRWSRPRGRAQAQAAVRPDARGHLQRVTEPEMSLGHRPRVTLECPEPP
jgi:hypothetical protein